MAEPNWEPLVGRSSFATSQRMTLQERQSDQSKILHGSYTVGYHHAHETDFLMSSIVSQPPSTPAPTSPVADNNSHSFRSTPSSPRPSIGNMLDVSSRRRASSVVDVEELQTFLDQLPTLPNLTHASERENKNGYGAISSDEDDDAYDAVEKQQHGKTNISQDSRTSIRRGPSFLGQLPAIMVASLLNLMMAIPFGVAYFPIGWSGTEDGSAGGEGGAVDGVSGPFPLPGKEQLGIRMCLLSTIIGQIVMTFASKFTNGLCYQQVESVPFFHSLAYIAISQQGYGKEALSTVFFLFGLSSILTGIFFYLLGRLDLGKVVYYIPSHVLVGCIGGIGFFITRTAIEVTTGAALTFGKQGMQSILDNMQQLLLVVAFEATLRILIWTTKGRVPLLSPIYFCAIPLMFYAGLWLTGADVKWAEDAGYFFPSPSSGEDGGFFQSAINPHTFDLLKAVDFRTISWTAVMQASGTMVALASFSLLHVPINIPAFSISIGVDTDMNAELVAHGYSNLAAGVFGQLPNYMTYSNSVLYAKSNGDGKVSSLLVVFCTFILFLFGPSIATYIPKCMASVLLLHVGADLVLEGVVDSYYDYDNLEYTGILGITLVMAIFGMTPAMFAGVIAALSVYAAQSIVHSSPIREILSAKNLRSSIWTRPAAELVILNDDIIGRSRVLIIQLHGHLFFGNVNLLTDKVNGLLSERLKTDTEPVIVILDFSLVIGLDSSAAHAVAKMNSKMHRRFHVVATVFVTPTDGFPCDYALSKALSKHPVEGGNVAGNMDGLSESLVNVGHSLNQRNRVCDNLDDALIFAEDVLIARQDISLLARDRKVVEPTGWLSEEDERRLGAQQLANLFPSSDDISHGIQILFSFFEREEYKAKDILWKEGDESSCAKLLVRGELVSYSGLEFNEETSKRAERVPTGNIVGELGLVNGGNRLSTLECVSEKAVLFSLSLESWKTVKREHPRAAIFLEEIVIRYLSTRVQHVGRIFETRCLPV